MRLGFSKSARLTRASDFARLKREGTTHGGRFLVFSALVDGEGPARLGLITTRRVGGAVERNRIRRHLRELFRAMAPQIRRGVWLVVIARQRAAEATFAALRAEWQKLAERAGILQAPCSP